MNKVIISHEGERKDTSKMEEFIKDLQEVLKKHNATIEVETSSYGCSCESESNINLYLDIEQKYLRNFETSNQFDAHSRYQMSEYILSEEGKKNKKVL